MRPAGLIPAISTYGGGTNSTAMLARMALRGDPAPIAILFGDTGGEKPHTYAYISYFSDWLSRHGYPPITILRRARRDKTWKSLEQDCLDKHRLPSIAYGWKTCSAKYKREPQEKWCNNNRVCKDTWKSDGKIIKMLGFDYKELHRAKFGEDKKYIYKYPLIEWKWDRDTCVSFLLAAGLRLPGKSACFFCPSSKKSEISLLTQEYPDLIQRALYMEANAILRTVKGLGRRFAWREYVSAVPVPDRSAGELDIDCGCYDGVSGGDRDP